VDGWHSRGYLPHLKAENASYFVTLRLADSLPKDVVVAMKRGAEERLRSEAKARNHEECLKLERQVNRDYFRKLEKWLDAGHGACWLRQSEIAALVSGAFAHFRNERYVLHAWVIMPNHAHVVVQPLPGNTLSIILQSWKSYTSKEAAKLLEQSALVHSGSTNPTTTGVAMKENADAASPMWRLIL
jgi:hypothetical protein